MVTKKLASLLLGSSLLAACYMGVGDGADPSNGSNGANGAPNGSSTSTPASGGTCAGDPWSSVQALMAAKCDSCHGATPSAGAPMSLLTPAELKAPSKTNPSLTNAQLSIQRMQANTMPPGGGAANDVAVLQAWIDAGYPAANPNACDAGATTVYEAGPNPYNTPLQCSSGFQGTHQEQGNGTMNPGEDCMSCHAVGGGNEHQFIIAGSVYKTAHEPNDCSGVAGGLTVSGTDKNGSKWSTKVNSAGNFYVYSGTIVAPLSNIVVTDGNGKTRAMGQAAPTGACNSCHTATGANNAPGRVMAP